MTAEAHWLFFGLKKSNVPGRFPVRRMQKRIATAIFNYHHTT